MRKLAIHLALWLGLFALRLLFAVSKRYADGGHGPWRGECITAALFASVFLGLVLAAEWRVRTFHRPKA